MKSSIIKIVTPLAFRSDESASTLLRRFSIIEADSAWQLIQALRHIDDARLKARLFHNAKEEMEHAEIFSRLANSLAKTPPKADAPVRRNLFKESGTLAAFEAYHHVGEADVFNQFEAYARAAPEGPIRDAFLAIRADEAGHQEAARENLDEIAGSKANAEKLIKRVRYQRLRDAFERGGAVIGDFVSSLLLTVLYLFFGPFVFLSCRARLRSVEWSQESSKEDSTQPSAPNSALPGASAICAPQDSSH
jgi:rubrerythrin